MDLENFVSGKSPKQIHVPIDGQTIESKTITCVTFHRIIKLSKRYLFLCFAPQLIITCVELAHQTSSGKCAEWPISNPVLLDAQSVASNTFHGSMHLLYPIDPALEEHETEKGGSLSSFFVTLRARWIPSSADGVLGDPTIWYVHGECAPTGIRVDMRHKGQISFSVGIKAPRFRAREAIFRFPIRSNNPDSSNVNANRNCACHCRLCKISRENQCFL